MKMFDLTWTCFFVVVVVCAWFVFCVVLFYVCFDSYNVQTLISSANGTIMIDPLSLNDFPEVQVGQTFNVDVTLTSSASEQANESSSYATKTQQAERK